MKRWVDKGESGGEATSTCRAKTGTSGPRLEMPLYSRVSAAASRACHQSPFLQPAWNFASPAPLPGAAPRPLSDIIAHDALLSKAP